MTNRERRLRHVRRFVLAASDMRQAAAAAEYLRSEHLNGDLCRALETAICVCYARPFSETNTIGPVDPKKWAPADAPARYLHESLLYYRDKAFAPHGRGSSA